MKNLYVAPVKNVGEDLAICSNHDADMFSVYEIRPDKTSIWIADFKAIIHAQNFVDSFQVKEDK